MKKSIIVLSTFFVLFAPLVLMAQDIPEPYSARAYWLEKTKESYRALKEKQFKNEPLSKSETQWMGNYEKYLVEYYEKMSEAEQKSFVENKDAWNSEAGITENANMQIETINRDPSLLIKHIAYSGFSGASYGVMLTTIFDWDGAAQAGVPLLLAGTSMLFPVYSKKYTNINNNSLWLRSHGKIVGTGSGLMLGALFFGDNFIDSDYEYYNGTTVVKEKGYVRPTLAFALVSSLALGELGFNLGKNRKWTEGKVSLYQYYGYYTPAVTTALMASAEVDNVRVVAASTIVSAGVGYVLADKIAGKFDYTRGDVGAIVGLNAIGTVFGIGIIGHTEAESIQSILIPTATSLAANWAGHKMLQDVRLSRPQGRRVNYAALGGGLIGLGTVTLFEPDNFGAYATVPSVTAFIGYLAMLNYYKKNNGANMSFRNRSSKFNISYQLHPESIYLNKLSSGKVIAPMFDMSIRF